MRGPFEDGDFRRLFAGRVVTNVGDSFYFVAAMWLVYELTGDPTYSGVAGFLTLAPSALQFLFGPLVDRWPLRAVLTGTQAVQAVVVLAVPAAAAAGALHVGVVLAVMPALSLLNQMVYPAQSAALPRILDDEDLVAANSAFSIAYQGVDMVANAAAGAVVALVGAVALFALDAVTFVVAAGLFLTVTVPPADGSDGATGNTDPAGGEGQSVATDGGPDERVGYAERLREGGAFLRGTFLGWLVLGAAVVNFTGGAALATMPAYGDGFGGAGAYGLLMAGFAAGNLAGAVGATVVDDRPLGTTLIAGFGASSVVWTAAVLVDWLPATALLVAVAMVPAGVVNVQLSAVVQSAVPERLVGRVSSLLGSATAVAIPVGSLAGGVAAGLLGAGTTMLANGVAFFVLAVYALAVPSLRRLPAADRVKLQ